MQPLVDNLQSQGLSHQQIETLFLTIHGWLEDHYPMMAQISKPVFAHELSIPELRKYA